jgi:thiol-disulfide isomerase/thioredoxin
MNQSALVKIFAIVASLATGTIVGMNALQATIPSASSLIDGSLLAKADTALAKQLQGKPVVVDIYASWCPGCKNIAPTLSKLEQQYGTKMNLVVFDVSDAKTTQASMKKAASLGLTNFFNAHKSKTSTVAIIDPATGKVVKQFQNNPELADYTTVLDVAIAKMSSGDAMKKDGAAMSGDAMKK